MPIDLSVRTDHPAKTVVLTVRGEVDIASIGELESSIASLDESDYGLVVDLTATDFMDSTGIRLLMAAHEQYRDSGREMKVAVNGGPIRRLLDVTGVLTHLNAYASVDEALSS